MERTKYEPKRGVPIEETKAYKEIREALDTSGFKDVPSLPLRFSKAFDGVFKEGVSIESMVRAGGINVWNYQDLANQLEAITKHIKQTINEQ